MNQLRPAILLTLFFIIVTGFAFPAAITGLAQAVFPHQANGSLIVEKGQVIGSGLIGQTFTKVGYFHSRPSAAGGGYDASNSGGTNLGPTSDKLINGMKDGSFLGIKQLASAYREENGLSADAILPADAVTRSASGLDPAISVRNAYLQAPRVAKARGQKLSEVETLIQQNTTKAAVGVFGEDCVNVLNLNLALDRSGSVNH